MKKKGAPICLVILLLIILASEEVVPVAEAMVCEVPSGGHKGLCVSDTNCAQICIGEGFGGGHCEGLRGRCMCLKSC